MTTQSKRTTPGTTVRISDEAYSNLGELQSILVEERGVNISLSNVLGEAVAAMLRRKRDGAQ